MVLQRLKGRGPAPRVLLPTIMKPRWGRRETLSASQRRIPPLHAIPRHLPVLAPIIVMPREMSELFRVKLLTPGNTRITTNVWIAWIDSYEEGEEIPAQPTDRLLSAPSRAHAPQHPFQPTPPARRTSQDGYVDTYDDVAHGIAGKKPETGFFGGHREPVKGRKWDHAREGDPVIMQSGVIQTSSPWRTYIKSSMYGPALDEDGKIVDAQFLQQQTPGYQKPWRGDMEGNDDPEKLSGLLHNKKQRRTLMKRFQVWLSHNVCGMPLTAPAHSSLASNSTTSISDDSSHNFYSSSWSFNLCAPSFWQIHLPAKSVYHYGNCGGRHCHSIHSLHNLGWVHGETIRPSISKSQDPTRFIGPLLYYFRIRKFGIGIWCSDRWQWYL